MNVYVISSLLGKEQSGILLTDLIGEAVSDPFTP
jgi:hypothetical protein